MVHAMPIAQQEHIDINLTSGLQIEAGIGNAIPSIEIDGEIPKIL
jgi:hypothetical protein